MRVLITGGTGALAREIIALGGTLNASLRLTSRHRPTGDPPTGDPRPLDWAAADLVTGEGLSDAVRDVNTVIHTASDFRRSHLVDVQGTQRLLDHCGKTGVEHLIYVSIVGIDQIPYRYYQDKLVAEHLVESGPVPFTILRATQFHSLIDQQLTAAARFPAVMPLPVRFRFQSIATREVAARVVQLVLEGPAQHAPDLGGPEIFSLADAARAWKSATGITKRVLPIFVPGKTAAGFRAGKNTVATGLRGTITWRDWLAQRYPSKRE